jgi:hypothetical protein
MTGLAEAAAEAYLTGWALTGAPFTSRVEAGCIAAVGCALEHPHDPGVLEATLELGKLTGVWQTVYDRRERLLRKHLRSVLAAWRDCTAALDPRDVVRRFRRDTYMTEAVTKDPQKKWWQEAGKAAALGWLYAVYHADGYDALVAAMTEAIREGMAEGEAGALALAASRQGKTGFRIADAFKAAYARLANDHGITQKAAAAVTAIIDGTANDVGRRLASLAGDGASEDDMTSGARDVLNTGQALRVTLQDALWAAMGAAALALFTRAATGQPPPGAPPSPGEPPQPPPGMIMVNWVTESGNPCQACLDNEAGSPYAPQDVPSLPQHPRCQCAIYAADDIPSSFFAAYLLS